MTTQQPIADQLHGELIEQFADFFNTDAVRVPPYKLRRWTYGSGKRTYFEIKKDGSIRFYPGITGLLKKVMPTPWALIEWIAKNGLDDSTTLRDEAADYGTAMHIVFAAYLLGDPIDFDELPNKLPKWNPEWKNKLQSDLLAFAAFVFEHNVKPLAIEAMIRSDKFGYACTVDLVCNMTIGTGQNGKILKKDAPKHIVAVVDFKSGRKGFYESHEIQAEACRHAWNESGIGPQATHSFNWSPKEWTGSEPTWNLKDQTSALAMMKLEHYVALWYADNDPEPKPLRIYDSVIAMGSNVEQCFRDVPVTEIIRRKYGMVESASVELDLVEA